MIENKALRFDGRIEIPRDQLDRLVELQNAGIPVFYGLPALPSNFRTRPLVELRFNPRFEQWQRILTPSEVEALVHMSNVLDADHIAAQPQTSSPSLFQFRRDLKTCGWVSPTPSGKKPAWIPRFLAICADQLERARAERRPSQIYSIAVTAAYP